MVQTHHYFFDGKIPGGASIEFLLVEVPIGENLYSPFVLVHYSVEGQEQEYGFCLDLDKQVFLDHFDDDQEKEEVMQKAAPKITEFLEPILEGEYGREE